MVKHIRINEPLIAFAFSFLWIKLIVTGTKFQRLPLDLQIAALAHENGHLSGHHTEWRLICLLLAAPLFPWLCHRQEFAADKYAASCGHADELIRILASDYRGGLLHPSNAERRRKLELYEQVRVIPVKDNLDRLDVTHQGA